MENKNSEVSEIRQDPVSKDWVVIATGRAKRPHDFKREEGVSGETDIENCPFENPASTGHKIISEDDWVTVIENKYPVVRGVECGNVIEKGPYEVQSGSGYHEIVISKDHNRSLAQMTQEEAEKVVKTYQERYRDLRDNQCSEYVLIFHNHGKKAGASIFHPHSQIMAIPIIPADVRRSLNGSKEYFEKNKKCVHCDMVEWERSEGKRIIFENETMLVVSPYVPRTAFETRIYPKEHESYFENIDERHVEDLAEALRVALGKIFIGLNNPSYNFYIHTSPSEQGEGSGRYDYYHWHLEILPKTSIWAGFELGTGVEISAMDPDETASYLREQDISNVK